MQVDDAEVKRRAYVTNVDAPILIYLRRLYLCSVEAKAIFSTNRHVCDKSDNISTAYNIVLCCCQDSSYPTGDWLY
jgi:hypothetical protein